jgi:hypothetical protein
VAISAHRGEEAFVLRHGNACVTSDCQLRHSYTQL